MADQAPSASTPGPKAIRPRNVTRKSKAEREAYEKQEEERRAARSAAAASANASIAGTQTKRPDRKTKDGKQRDGQPLPGSGSGVFGASGSGRATGSRRIQDTGKSEMLEGQEGVKPEDEVKTTSGGGGSNTFRTDIPGGGNRYGGTGGAMTIEESGGYEIEADLDDQIQRDIEDISVPFSDEDELEDEETFVPGKGKARMKSARSQKLHTALRPVRAPRESEDENTHDESATKKPRKHARSRHLSSEDEEADGDLEEDQAEALDGLGSSEQLQVKQDIPSSPELGRRKTGRKVAARTKDSRTAVETAEEKAERIRLHDDIRRLKKEFVAPLNATDLGAMGEDENRIDDSQGEKLFLLQLPPLVPYLVSSDAESVAKSPVMTIKKDPDAPTAPISNADAGGAGASATKAPPPGKPHSEGVFTADEPSRLPAGRVGKLRIHQSGKVTLDWGGTDMELRYGTKVDFLQDVVLVEGPQPQSEQPDVDEGKTQEQATLRGHAYALGQVRQKLVAIPDWQKLYD